MRYYQIILPPGAEDNLEDIVFALNKQGLTRRISAAASIGDPIGLNATILLSCAPNDAAFLFNTCVPKGQIKAL